MEVNNSEVSDRLSVDVTESVGAACQLVLMSSLDPTVAIARVILKNAPILLLVRSLFLSFSLFSREYLILTRHAQ